MRRSIVAGNWKMNGTKSSVNDLVAKITEHSKAVTNAELLVIPPFVFLAEVAKMLASTNIKLGAQNLCEKSVGAFTGEVSGAMLKEFGCSYVLVGHSERRQIFHEDDKLIAAKFKMALASGLVPILCIGETLAEREAGITEKVVSAQLQAVLDVLSDIKELQNAVIAYEPVWAIGTGVTATKEQAQAVHDFIRKKIAKINAEVAENLAILYGGSVKSTNARELFSMPDIDGGLIGGASLDANDFIAIGKACNS